MNLNELMQWYDFTGKTAVITGGTGVLGGEIAYALVGCGANVAVLDRNPELPDFLKTPMNAGPGKYMVVYADVLDRGVLAKAAQTIQQAYGRIDILINAAEGNHPQATTSPDNTFFDLPAEAMGYVFERGTIGIKDTPVRAMIHAAAEYVPTPSTLMALVVVGQGLAGLFIGDYLSAWSAAADLSSQRHITWVDKPFQRVLSCAPPVYDELWTGGKAMYKLEPALAEGGELIIYAPHLDVVSHVHGKYIYEIGYHVLPYFLKQWDRFRHIPLGILAHSTHVRGDGRFENGVEYPRAKVTLATKLSPEDCTQLALGYQNPDEIDLTEWQNREGEEVLYVPKSGEMLYRVKNKQNLEEVG